MLSRILTPDCIKMNLESTEKEECFAELLEVIVAKQPQINRYEAFEALIQRENKLSTAIADKIAVPHAISKSINKTAISIGITKQGIEFMPVDSSCKNPLVNIIFEILFEENDTDLHLHVLKDILQLVKNPDFIKKVMTAQNSHEVYDIILSLD